MPELPLPTGGCALSGGDLPVSDGADVLSEFDEIHRRPNQAPIRDAFAAAFAESHKAYQDAIARAAAQCDPTRATGDYLGSLASERKVVTADSEEATRARMFIGPKIVTRTAILDAVNEILERRSAKRAVLLESELDCWFVHSGAPSVWDSFVGAPPDYPDRLYEHHAAENDGVYIPDSTPNGAIPMSNHGRRFHVRIPVLDAADEQIVYVTGGDDGWFVHSSDPSAWDSFVYEAPATAEELYREIVGVVDRIKGQGMSWSLIVDPDL